MRSKNLFPMRLSGFYRWMIWAKVVSSSRHILIIIKACAKFIVLSFQFCDAGL